MASCRPINTMTFTQTNCRNRRDEVSIEMPLELELAAGVEEGLYNLGELVEEATEGLDCH